MRRLASTAVLGLVFGAAALLLPLSAGAGDPEKGAADPPRRFVRVPAPDGIQIRRFNKTDGPKPERDSRVTVHYHGTLTDGTVFDSSVERGHPANFPLDKVVPCWTEALTRLRVGEKAEVRCPPKTAYGLKGSPPAVPPNATLIFEVEILGIR
ncbi:MAG: FKBP-type peptidyl-prolyl cis-trans isomerase [Myxococcota bacterium]